MASCRPNDFTQNRPSAALPPFGSAFSELCRNAHPKNEFSTIGLTLWYSEGNCRINYLNSSGKKPNTPDSQHVHLSTPENKVGPPEAINAFHASAEPPETPEPMSRSVWIAKARVAFKAPSLSKMEPNLIKIKVSIRIHQISNQQLQV